jgi:hypothetical protein
MGEGETTSDDGVLSDDQVEILRRLEALYENADQVAIKKLSKNDRSWAWPIAESHQAGFYVPGEFRGTFFPADHELSARADKPHILQSSIPEFDS